MIEKILKWLGLFRTIEKPDYDVVDEYKKSLQLGYCENCGQPMYKSVKVINFDIRTGLPKEYEYILKCGNPICWLHSGRYGFISKAKIDPDLDFYLKHEFSELRVLDRVDDE